MANAAVGPAATLEHSRLRGLLGNPLTSQALAFTIAGAAIGMSMAVMRLRGGR
jgi:hypothetical protein